MRHLRPINRKAARIAEMTASPGVDLAVPREGAAWGGGAPTSDGASHGTGDPGAQEKDVVALQQGAPQQPQPHIPLGCSFVFSPGWEADRTGGTAGLCQPVERDLFDCHLGCFWPAQVPDQLNHSPDWTAKCAAAQKDWRKIDLVFP